MKVPSFDLTEQNKTLRDELMTAIEDVVAGGQFILGDVVVQFEEAIAGVCGTKYGVGVANGSDALYIAIEALGIGRGDEVITTPFTFFATAGAIVRAGATPVFADIDPQSYNIDPAQVERKITNRTKAVLPVHLYGQPADMDPINELARRHGLRVIEDAAQAIGSEYRGRKAGQIGDVACISFFPTKNLGAFGDAGMIVTDDAGIAEKARLLRAHGSRKKYFHEIMGINSRLDAIQAKILSVKLKYLHRWAERRREIARAYNSALNKESAAGKITLPLEIPGARHVYHQYTISVRDRDALKAFLSDRGVGSAVYYPVALHMQKVFAGLGYREGDFPLSERACQTVLSLPIYPEMTVDQVNHVAGSVREFVSRL
jgi:dTDP-4-amino-4,6-dideoxygalactose transaminase